MGRWIVTGISTDVGKTVVSAILVKLLQADYWKPIEAGGSDTQTIHRLSQATCHSPAYQLKHPLSPHHGAKLEGVTIESKTICPPQTDRPLIIEGCGGVMVPFNATTHFGTLFSSWKLPWILVSKNYLGSINHTLLSIEWLRQKGQTIQGIVFNGEANPESESFILSYSGLNCLGRVLPEKTINQRVIQWYATQFKPLWKEI